MAICEGVSFTMNSQHPRAPRDSMINLAEQPLSSTAFSEHFPSYSFLNPEIVPFSLSY